MTSTLKAEPEVIEYYIDIYEGQSTNNEKFNNNEFIYAKLRPAINY